MPDDDVTAWILCGGEGRRMGGVDKGLQAYRGQPLVTWVMQALVPQTTALFLNANRHLDEYEALRQRHAPAVAGDVRPDAEGLAPWQGPLAGMLTGLRIARSPWVLFASCDSPALPADLVSRLMAGAYRDRVDIAVPLTCDADGTTRHHWVCILVHRRVLPTLEASFHAGERRVRAWVGAQAWASVSFEDPAAFSNINTLETLHGAA